MTYPFEDILSRLPDGIVVTNAASEIVWANDAYCALMGYSLDELRGKTPKLLRSPFTADSDIERLWDNLSTTGAYQTRLLNKRRNGSLFHASLSFARVSLGNEALFVCSVRDVSVDVEMERRLSELTAQAVQSRDVTIYSLASLAEQRDQTTGKHLQRIESYTRRMTEWVLQHHPDRLPSWARDAQTIARCSILHDIGKVGIPDGVLSKKSGLSEEEQHVMRDHTRLGTEIIDRVLAMQADSAFLRIARDIIACHHEAWDGSGYPSGLKEDEIPLVAQIVTVADVFDALTSHRPYKPAHHSDEAAAWIVQRRGVQFGPLAVDAFMACFDAIRNVQRTLGDAPTDEPIRPSGIKGREPIRLPNPTEPPTDVGRARILDAIAEGMSSRHGGEIVVRSRDRVGRITLRDRRVTWAQLSGDQDLLIERIRLAGHLADDDLTILNEECKRSGRNMLALIAEWGLIPQERLRSMVREHVAVQAGRILELPMPAVMFVPQPQRSEVPMTFAIEEILPATPPASELREGETTGPWVPDWPAAPLPWSGGVPHE